ncbi:hypothetical protein SANTM175S_04806 [Streptomyces antimycoticus]
MSAAASETSARRKASRCRSGTPASASRTLACWSSSLTSWTSSGALRNDSRRLPKW